MKHGIYKRSFKLIYNTLKNEIQIEKAILFGSRAMGNAKKGSDIDIAVLGSEVSQKLINKIRTELNEEQPIPYFIDIVDYRTIENRELKKHIDEHGVTIFEREKAKS